MQQPVDTSSKEEITEGLKNLPGLMKKNRRKCREGESDTEKSSAILDQTGEIVSDNNKNIDAAMESFRDMAKNLKETTDDVKAHPRKLLRKP